MNTIINKLHFQASNNNKLFMKCLLLYAITIGFVLVNKDASAQGFLMSSLRTMGTSSSNISPMNFKSNANCINVETGIAMLSSANGNGAFSINCAITQVFNTLGIKLFPNPVNNFTKAKLINTPPLTESFNVSVWNTEGVMISTRKETGYNLFQGIMLDLGNVVSGSYILKVESAQFVETIKFIKAN